MSGAEAVPPQGSPVPTMSDLAYAHMSEWQESVVRPFAGATGLPPGTVLFTLALFASLPLGAGFQLIPSPALKNVYSLVTGASEALANPSLPRVAPTPRLARSRLDARVSSPGRDRTQPPSSSHASPPSEPLGARSTRPSTVTTLEPPLTRPSSSHPIAGVALSALRSAAARMRLPRAISYLMMAIDRKRCGYLVFAFSFGYLIYCHATSPPASVESRQHRHHRPSDGAHPEGDGVRFNLGQDAAPEPELNDSQPAARCPSFQRRWTRGLAGVPVHACRRPCDRLRGDCR